jgi:hypothetical protein
MTKPNYKALCAELVSNWDDVNGDQDFLCLAETMERARTALAQPEPVAPTDEELITIAEKAGLCYPVCWDLREGDVSQMAHLREFARAVLAKRGQQ